MDSNERLLRTEDIIKGNKDQPPIIPVSKSVWYRGVKSGEFPKPFKVSFNIPLWRKSDIYAYIATDEDEKKQADLEFT